MTRPGAKAGPKGWRVQSDDSGAFDELVVRDLSIHLEMMGRRTLDVHFGDVHLAVWRTKRGAIRVRRIDGTILDARAPS